MYRFIALLPIVTLTVVYGQEFPEIQEFMNFPFGQRHFPVSVYGEPSSNFNENRWEGRMHRGRPSFHGKLRTKVRNETKGNMKIEEIEKDGDGYHSFSRLTTYNDPHAKGGKFAMTDQEGQKIIDELTDNVTKREECNGKKPCPKGKFCHPMSMSCVAQVEDGKNCFMKGQCLNDAKGIKCIFGKCRQGKDGQPGSICSLHDECGKDSCCTPGTSGIRMCRKRLEEGALCSQPISFTGLFGFGVKRKQDTCNPCKDGLECVETAGFLFGEKSCLPAKFAEQEKLNEGPDEEDDSMDMEVEADDASTPENETKPSAGQKPAASNQPSQPSPNSPLSNLMGKKENKKPTKGKAKQR